LGGTVNLSVDKKYAVKLRFKESISYLTRNTADVGIVANADF